MGVNGFDVSHLNGEVDWDRVKAEDVKFTFLKASEGFTWEDDRFLANWKGAASVGISTGAYHFFSPKDGTKQAENLLRQLDAVSFANGDLLPVLDIETYEAAKMSVKAFVDQVTAMVDKVSATLGAHPMIYTTHSFWQRIGNPDFSHCPLWVADLRADAPPRLPKGWSDFAVHQYSFTGTIAGIKGDVDLDQLNGDDLSIIRYQS